MLLDSFFSKNLPNHHLLLKLDFEKAFNCLCWDKILDSLYHQAPLPSPFVHAAYTCPSMLFFGRSIIHSQKGVEQVAHSAPPHLILFNYPYNGREALCILYSFSKEITTALYKTPLLLDMLIIITTALYKTPLLLHMLIDLAY